VGLAVVVAAISSLSEAREVLERGKKRYLGGFQSGASRLMKTSRARQARNQG